MRPIHLYIWLACILGCSNPCSAQLKHMRAHGEKKRSRNSTRVKPVPKPIPMSSVDSGAVTPPSVAPLPVEQLDVAALRHSDITAWKIKKKEARIQQRLSGEKPLGDAGRTNLEFSELEREVERGGRLASVPCTPPYCTFRCRSDAPCKPHPLMSKWKSPGPRLCDGGRKIFPISFGIPESEIVDCVPVKAAGFATVVPYRTKSYIFGPADEAEYKRDYRKSFYGVTRKKEGWDCMRHYEIMASGSVPMFLDISDAPDGVMTHLPKDLLRHVRESPQFTVRGCEMRHELGVCDIELDQAKFDQAEYDSVACSLLEHTKKHLTTKSLASYVLKATGNDQESLKSNFRALYIGGTAHNSDYLRDLMFHGFRELLGEKLFEYNTPRYMYEWPSTVPTNEAIQNPNKLWGMGFTVARRLPYIPQLHIRNQTAAIDLILSHYFDLIIYGNAHRGLPLWYAVVKAAYPQSKVVVFNGEDWHGWKQVEEQQGEYKILDRASYFLRELPDGCPNA